VEVKLMVQTAWSIHPSLALRLAERFKNAYIEEETRSLVRKFSHQARKVPEALEYFAQQFDPLIIPNMHVGLSLSSFFFLAVILLGLDLMTCVVFFTLNRVEYHSKYCTGKKRR
jgi:hypothetical protein